jgi:DNA-binding response OmpR family regulator
MTARDDMPSKQKGYAIGIDDYMVKPIEMDELLLRIAALLRRANISNERKLTVGSLTLNEMETTAYIHEVEVPLTVREFQILFKLLSYPKRTFTRMQLMDEFWGFESESNPRTVDVSITKLRDKISECQDVEIITVRGLGYKAVIKA